MKPSPPPFQSTPSWAIPLGFAFMYLAWGGTYLAVKFAIVDFPVLLMTGARFFLAGALLLAAIFLFDRSDFRAGTRPEWIQSARVGLLLLVFGIGTGNWTQQYVDSSFAAMVFSALPLWIVVIDWIRPGGAPPTRSVAGGLLLGFAGVGLILAPSAHAGIKPVHLGIGLLLVAASIAWASGAVASRYVRAEGSPLLPVARQMLVAGFTLLVLGCLDGDLARLHFAGAHPASWIGFAYLLGIGSFTGYPVYIWLMRSCPPSKVATIPYINLLVAILLGWSLGHETITPRLLVGTGIVLVSVAIVLRARIRPEPSRLSRM